MIDGLGMNLSNLSRLSSAQTRSVSAENFTGEKGKGGMALEGTGKDAARSLGQGWKISPSILVSPGECRVLADIEGPGAIQHIWMTPTGVWRHILLRIYWEEETTPSVECPIGDFFANAYAKPFTTLTSLAVCVNPTNGFNCYWEMPFRRRARITLENIGTEAIYLFYQVDYVLTPVPEDCAYFHAQFRRTNPVPYGEVHTILDGVRGKGQYVGTYMAWGSNNNGWWGEGEIKFYLDGDGEFPTVCGTGTEDYFGGAFCFITEGQYQEYSGPYCGMPKVVRPDGLYQSQMRFSLYRWHIPDPIRFEQDLRVTIQALGWRKDGRYLPLQDDLSSVAYWYQTLPAAPFKPLPDADQLEIV
ncbi:MAG: DUF2961 domain-containing protein [Clostridiales bacterium]|nr:DUF2961 domain-containing protein [Clostridiales bacterium]